MGGSLIVKAEEAAFSLEKSKTIVAFGDSITRGYGVPEGKVWVDLLSARLEKKARQKDFSVLNAGGNGNTSGEGLKRIEKDVLSKMPALVLVEFGGNDTRHTAGGLTVDEFEQNILEIHKLVKAKGGTIALLTFPPVVNEWHALWKDPYYAKWGGLDQCAEQYRERTRELAKKLDCPIFDLDKFLRKQMKSKGQGKIIAKDGVHLTVEANELIADAIADFISKEFIKK
ncbi:MAG: hypothetical protein A2X49_17100 [Lentisphaerae bacterium GWF2_52_8]|nr:MAG: hypothetical protein A2X49_17100 [Lentisphaerae bacterium GWF2_52_8]